MKSLGANVFFPAWVWKRAEPQPRTNDLAYRFQVRTRCLARPLALSSCICLMTASSRTATAQNAVRSSPSPSYQRLWGHRVRLQPDPESENPVRQSWPGGNRISTSDGRRLLPARAAISLSLTIRITSAQSAAPATLPGRRRCASGTKVDAVYLAQRSTPWHVHRHGMQRVHERDLSGATF